MRTVSMWLVALVLSASVASAAVRRDTTRPSRPAKLTVMGVSSTQVNLSWAASNTQDIIFQTTGVTPAFFRPPYGSVDAAVEARIRAAGLHTALWTEDANDWAGATANDIFWTITTMQNGGIVLMHDQMPETAAAIPDIAWYLTSYWSDNTICAGTLAPTTHVVPMDDWWGMFFFVHAVPWR